MESIRYIFPFFFSDRSIFLNKSLVLLDEVLLSSIGKAWSFQQNDWIYVTIFWEIVYILVEISKLFLCFIINLL